MRRYLRVEDDLEEEDEVPSVTQSGD